ncbi:MAG: hypothetical protein JWQ38_3466 [Flavipsychrobacter sp.]|nr:hypothetical protein [Flavipsychrobacter sp.]
MKKLLQALFIIFLTTTTLYAQQGRNMARIHAAKMAYIQDRLHLSKDAFRNFAPVYDEYEKEIKDTRQSFFGKYQNTNTAQIDDAASRQLIDDNLDYQQKVIEIKRKYNDRFLKVLTPQQLAGLHMAEREFKQMLVQRLKNRRGRMSR